MAQIELRDCHIYFKDGLSGTAAVKSTESPAQGNTDLDIETIVLNSTDTDLVPVGARFSFAVTPTVFYTVTARTPTDTSPTTNITFTPALPASPPSASEVITFVSQEIEVKVGEGNATWTENKEYSYDKDRDDLDTVRELAQQPCEINLDFQWQHVKTGTSEDVTPIDALKGVGGAAEWVTSSDDACEPYAVEMLIEHLTPCGSSEDARYLFEDLRYDSLDFDLSEASISMTGRINKIEPTITRGDYS